MCLVVEPYPDLRAGHQNLSHCDRGSPGLVGINLLGSQIQIKA